MAGDVISRYSWDQRSRQYTLRPLARRPAPIKLEWLSARAQGSPMASAATGLTERQGGGAGGRASGGETIPERRILAGFEGRPTSSLFHALN